MQLAVFMLMGLIVGAVVFVLAREQPAFMTWAALALGVAGTLLFLGTINGWFLPDLGRFGAIAVGVLSGAATALAVGTVVKGERHAVNWIALVVSALPVVLLVVFGIAELVGPAH